MRFMSILILVGLVSPALGATIIDFEDWTGGPGDQTFITYAGFNFSGGPFFIATHPEGGNNTLTLQVRTGFLCISRADGGPFSVISLDLQEGSPTNPAIMVSLTGITQGVVAKEPFYLDGIANTYETFFPSGFVGINSLEFLPFPYLSTFSLDNLVVPEPSAVGMLVLAICLARR